MNKQLAFRFFEKEIIVSGALLLVLWIEIFGHVFVGEFGLNAC